MGEVIECEPSERRKKRLRKRADMISQCCRGGDSARNWILLPGSVTEPFSALPALSSLPRDLHFLERVQGLNLSSLVDFYDANYPRESVDLCHITLTRLG